jgi:hypothetical protein
VRPAPPDEPWPEPVELVGVVAVGVVVDEVAVVVGGVVVVDAVVEVLVELVDVVVGVVVVVGAVVVVDLVVGEVVTTFVTVVASPPPQPARTIAPSAAAAAIHGRAASLTRRSGLPGAGRSTGSR